MWWSIAIYLHPLCRNIHGSCEHADVCKYWLMTYSIHPCLPSLFFSLLLSPQGSASLVLWYGGYLVWHGSLQAGTLIALMLYTLNLAMGFAFLSNLYGEFMQVGHSEAIRVDAW